MGLVTGFVVVRTGGWEAGLAVLIIGGDLAKEFVAFAGEVEPAKELTGGFEKEFSKSDFASDEAGGVTFEELLAEAGLSVALFSNPAVSLSAVPCSPAVC